MKHAHRHPLHTSARRRFTTIAGLAGLIALGSADHAMAAYESVAFGVANYGGAGQCSGTPLVHSDNDAVAFYQSTRDLANYDDYRYWVNAAVDPVDFTDAGSDETWPYGTDWADTVFFSGHGGYYCPGGGYNRYTVLDMGDYATYPQECDVRLGSSSGQVEFASGGAASDANFLMMHASTALRYCAAQSGNMVFHIDDGGSGYQFTMLNGFHNSPADLGENDDKVWDYVGTSVYDGVGDHWGDVFQYRNGAIHECAVTSITSSSSSNANTLYFYGGLHDTKNTGNHVQHWYYYDCSRPQCYDLPWC